VNWTASNGEIDRMVSWVKHVRESIPKEMDLAWDMHGRYDATTGKRVAVALEPYRLLWLEEPVPPEDIDARWTDAIEQDYRSWLKQNEDHLSVPKEQIEEILREH
jgi:hypothetical protein